ncbi:voltage-dependent calcium channel subunit alpha-2/delta-3 isoform X3 [Nilaparvata lugens]|uniref:voltage-dependent calcium channel subunit alpha-2/delta-3 isoform X3 n=1 Tax=Nilaparvata lugens TaxID=108931 RepID=UPI00193D6F93|nr:voltage-dependent calcium channel subunit alpha-2/delta-3 isoform X3 [Nilaparvata lugens]
MDFIYFGLIISSILGIVELDASTDDPIPDNVLSIWSDRIGSELYALSEMMTRRNKILESFKEARVEPLQGTKLVEDIAKDLKQMMDAKMKAIERIMDTAQSAAKEFMDKGGKIPDDYKYYNSKHLVEPGTLAVDPLLQVRDEPKEVDPDKQEPPDPRMEMQLEPNRHFNGVFVNTTLSAVHVPTNIYDRSENVLPAIVWSEKLEPIFRDNYLRDPSMSWQYFGSSSGFMRHYPAKRWETEHVDLYDCRTRSWYVEAATSPKDVLILVDNSGSMTGERKEIARHVVNNILDTLGSNDFVNILAFINITKEVVPCFNRSLVQASLANVRELKIGMEKMEQAKNIANFKVALEDAFQILRNHYNSNRGSLCNQAIMLITDGVPYNYQEIFQKYNWVDYPVVAVRMFTYLIGREASEVREVKWMACANRGYYVHLSTTAEVQEQVLQYVPVMARPMVLQRTQHPIIWTPVYADITDPRMTDWLWELNEREEQRERSLLFRRHKEDQDKKYVIRQKKIKDSDSELQKYRLMTSVAIPVYDTRDRAKVQTGGPCKPVDPNCKEPVETKVAYLLGVAGTDIPIEDIVQLTRPHVLGVNAYAFIVTNNGYVLMHPDLRPVFQGILKPSYNSVDMTDVEIVDDDSRARNFSAELIRLRDAIVNQKKNQKTLKVKYHLDNLRRAVTGKRQYFYHPIEGTPFTLVLALPGHSDLHYKVSAEKEIKRLLSAAKYKSNTALNYFEGNDWSIHPDWNYCKYYYNDDPVLNKRHDFASAEEELVHFINRTGWPGWKWPSKPTDLRTNNSSSSKSDKSESEKGHDLRRESYFCDRSLFLSLVFDAAATAWFNDSVWSVGVIEEKKNDFMQRFGPVTVFVATRSGLTRWQDFPSTENDRAMHRSFGKENRRAIDEVWYKRAVDQHAIIADSYVYSVPFEADIEEDDRRDIVVTATRAVFIETRGKKAPAAVIGVQLKHSALQSLFINITYTCKDCKKTCSSDDVNCYVIDNNGYVVLSEEPRDTGRFFGELYGGVMERLVDEGVFRRIRLFDYQSVCFRLAKCGEGNLSSKLQSPLVWLGWFLNWLIGHVALLLMQMNMQWVGTLASFYTTDENCTAASPQKCGSVVLAGEKPAVSTTKPPIKVTDYPEYGPESECDDEAGGGEGGDRKQDNTLYANAIINRTRPRPCDKEVDLYTLDQKHHKLSLKLMPPSRQAKPCDRPFKIDMIPNSNLVLVVVNRLCPPLGDSGPLTISHNEVNYRASHNMTLACYKSRENNLSRKWPQPCIKHHPEEINITELCGDGCSIRPSLWMILLVLASYFVNKLL